MTEVGGATAVGLRNPNSLTDAIGKFAEALLPASSSDIPVIQLGEVDCGFVIWYRAKKYGESVASQLDQSVRAYFEFVDALIQGGYSTVVVTGAVLPTIRDGQDWGDVANARREITAKLSERTELTLAYNAMLRSRAKRRSIPYVEITDSVFDKDTGVVSDRFRHPDPRDHHLDPDEAGKLWAHELNRIAPLLPTQNRSSKNTLRQAWAGMMGRLLG